MFLHTYVAKEKDQAIYEHWCSRKIKHAYPIESHDPNGKLCIILPHFRAKLADKFKNIFFAAYFRPNVYEEVMRRSSGIGNITSLPAIFSNDFLAVQAHSVSRDNTTSRFLKVPVSFQAAPEFASSANLTIPSLCMYLAH